MFYCDTCGDPKGWPRSLYRSLGTCGVCTDKGVVCNSTPASKLPPAPPEPKSEQPKPAPDFFALIDIYAGLKEQAGAADEIPGACETAATAREHAASARAELERRWNLAGADHHLAIWRHLEGGPKSQGRQRELLTNAHNDKARGWTPGRAMQYIEQSIVDEWRKANEGDQSGRA